MSTHSPAPWSLDWKVAGGGHHPTIPTLQYICVESANKDEVDDPLRLTGYMRPTDAHLLAAAPDLLAALKKLVEWQDEVKHAIPRIYLDQAQNAIAKAEKQS